MCITICVAYFDQSLDAAHSESMSKYKRPGEHVKCIECEINKQKDYKFTLPVKTGQHIQHMGSR